MQRVEIRHTGGYALWMGEGARHCSLESGSYLHDLGGGGVRIGTMDLEIGARAASSNRIIGTRCMAAGSHTDQLFSHGHRATATHLLCPHKVDHASACIQV